MYECFYNQKTSKWKVRHMDLKHVASELLYQISPKGNSLGFICQDNIINKYVDKMKNSEIKDKQKEIEKLQKEIKSIESIQYPEINH